MLDKNFYTYCFDLNYENGSIEPFILENIWVIIDSNFYENFISKALSFKEMPEVIFKNGDKVYFSTDVNTLYPIYKIEDYCKKKDIKIDIVTDINQADVIVLDLLKSLDSMNSKSKTNAYVYPVKDLESSINKVSLKKANILEDCVLFDDSGYVRFKKHFKNKELKERSIYFQFVFSKEEVENQFRGNEPFLTLFEAISSDKKVISHKNLSLDMHKDALIIDEDIYTSLSQMLSSPDEGNKNLAISMIADANRNESLPMLLILYHKYSSIIKKGNQNAKEFTSFINEILGSETAEKDIRKKLQELGMDYKEVAKYFPN